MNFSEFGMTASPTTEQAFAICERVAEIQALLHDQRQALGRGRGCDGASRAVGI